MRMTAPLAIEVYLGTQTNEFAEFYWYDLHAVMGNGNAWNGVLVRGRGRAVQSLHRFPTEQSLCNLCHLRSPQFSIGFSTKRNLSSTLDDLTVPAWQLVAPVIPGADYGTPGDLFPPHPNFSLRNEALRPSASNTGNICRCWACGDPSW